MSGLEIHYEYIIIISCNMAVTYYALVYDNKMLIPAGSFQYFFKYIFSFILGKTLVLSIRICCPLSALIDEKQWSSPQNSVQGTSFLPTWFTNKTKQNFVC